MIDDNRDRIEFMHDQLHGRLLTMQAALRLDGYSEAQQLGLSVRPRGSGRECPLAPREDASVGTRAIGKHRDVLQQVTIGIAEVDRRRRHPGEHDGFVC